MPNNDLISLKYIIKELLKEREKFPAMVEERYSLGVKIPHKFNQAIRGGIRKALRIVETAPAVDAEPVRHGRWLKDAELNTYCSCCDGNIPTVHCHQDYEYDEYDWDEEIEKTEFCPNCGAKMEAKT